MVFWVFLAKKGASAIWRKHKARKNGGADVPGEHAGSGSSLPLLDYFVYFLPLPIILFYILCFTGCLGTSPGIPNLNLVSLVQNSNGTGEMTVRVGHFGMCFTADNIPTACTSAVGQTGESLAQRFLAAGSNSTTPSNGTVSSAKGQAATQLLSTAKVIQSKIFTPLLPATGVLFILGLAALVALTRLASRGGGRPYVVVRRLLMALLWGSAAGSLMVALATTQTSAALEYAATTVNGSGPSASGRVLYRGASVEALQWAIAVLESFFALRMAYAHRSTSAGGAAARSGGGSPEKGDMEMGNTHT
ncbi:hypothetical protein RB595_004264 [Gaeumannomyces hyphopodioides]